MDLQGLKSQRNLQIFAKNSFQFYGLLSLRIRWYYNPMHRMCAQTHVDRFIVSFDLPKEIKT